MISEVIAELKSRVSTATIDEDFARDVQLEPPDWD
jgi:hypothetical protein